MDVLVCVPKLGEATCILTVSWGRRIFLLACVGVAAGCYHCGMALPHPGFSSLLHSVPTPFELVAASISIMSEYYKTKLNKRYPHRPRRPPTLHLSIANDTIIRPQFRHRIIHTVEEDI